MISDNSVTVDNALVTVIDQDDTFTAEFNNDLDDIK